MPLRDRILGRSPPACEFHESALAFLTEIQQDRRLHRVEVFSKSHAKLRGLQMRIFESFFHDDATVFRCCVETTGTCVPHFPFSDCDAELTHFTVAEAIAKGDIDEALHLSQSVSSQAFNSWFSLSLLLFVQGCCLTFY